MYHAVQPHMENISCISVSCVRPSPLLRKSVHGWAVVTSVSRETATNAVGGVANTSKRARTDIRDFLRRRSKLKDPHAVRSSCEGGSFRESSHVSTFFKISGIHSHVKYNLVTIYTIWHSFTILSRNLHHLIDVGVLGIRICCHSLDLTTSTSWQPFRRCQASST